ncbi:MAG: hypothetical protein PHY99_00695 [Bacteroidales bacterium]|nr:hypothetical protein [Bacteroidales bacterium]
MKLRASLLVSALLTIGLLSSFQKDKPVHFYKGNLHTHSYWSDGNAYPEDIARWYHDNGYQFLAVTDHNILQEGRKVKAINGDSVVIKELSAYRRNFEKPGEFLLISGEEISDASEKKPVHLCGFNMESVVKPAGGETVADCLLADVRAIRKTLSGTENPEWIVVNHPNFGWGLTTDALALSSARFFEVFNGHPSVNNYGDSAHPSTETMWDEANKWRIDHGEALLLGTATDDTHNYDVFGVGKANPGRGWVVVRARELTPAALYRAMYAGDFYASTGIELTDFRCTRKNISITIKGEKEILYTTEFIGWLEGKSQPEVLQTTRGITADYRLTGKELFVRARILSSKQKKNPFATGDVEMAWLQPVVKNQK